MKYFFLLLLFSIGLFIWSCTSKKPLDNTVTNSQNNQISVLFDANGTPKKLASQFNKYKLEPLGQSSKSENKWTYIYDASLISGKKLAIELMELDFVVEAMPIDHTETSVQSGVSGEGKKVKINSGN